MSKKEEIKTEVTDDDFYGLLMTVTEQCDGISDSHKKQVALKNLSSNATFSLKTHMTSLKLHK